MTASSCADRRGPVPNAAVGTTIAMAILLAACGEGAPVTPATPGTQGGLGCSIPESQIVSGGVPRDGIPALNNPEMAQAGSPAASYMTATDRVIGIIVDGQPFAIPHRVLWHHEIVNLSAGSDAVAATYCPLTGSSLVFDRASVDGAEFGVSGLLFRNNLIMYDRRTNESLWPQMARGARCGPSTGLELQMFPSIEMTWGRWVELHPNTRVPAEDVAAGLPFGRYGYPYGDYERIDNSGLLFPLPSIDERRPPKERVLGVPFGDGMAFPFGELAGEGPVAAAHRSVAGRQIVVFWDGAGASAAAFYPRVAGSPLTFDVEGGAIVDAQSGSVWSPQGIAVDGPMAGERLEPVDEAYVAFWFAWAAFHPSSEIWVEG